ncbi:M16 family metallopeptidase [Kistimonas asteriae]|uniref:M16 family metallopeptidase n=1 Tax=Kistimonas asteriae TaxID=517724 RepID=UPI001BAC1C50|nr:pitrilysin family protein [Kistimonas asteriae]
MMHKPKLKQTLLILALGSTLLAGCNSLSSSLLSTDASTAAIQQLPKTAIAYEKFTLDNGLTVIVHEDRKAPVVAVNLWYKVGSKDESVGKRGFAHLFEHLMFQGSENYDDEFFRPFEEAGATGQNGTTNTDRTNYFETVPTPALDMALWMESDRMGHFLGAITQEKLDQQRGVVKNEKRQGENQPYGKVWNRLAEQTFPEGHPYSWPTIGYMEDLDDADLELVKNWFKTYYGPSNAVLVMAGDIDVATAREKANLYFGDIPAGPPLAKMDSWIAKRTEEKRDSMQDRVPQARVMKVWNTAPAGSTDSEYLSLASDVLAGGKNSRLYKRLVHDEQLATSVNAFVYDRMLAGQFMIVADAKDGVSLSHIEAIIDEELEKFLKKGPTEKELQRIKFSQAAAFVRGTERVGGFGGKSDILAHGEVYFGDPGHYLKSFDAMQNATPAMIRKAADKWLSSGAYVLDITPFPNYEHAAEGADRNKLPSTDGKVSLSLPALERATLSNGLKVVLAPRHQTPVVSMELQFDGGLSGRLGKPGLPGLTMAMMDEGTASKTSLELAEELETIGTSLSTGNDFDTSSIYLDSLKVTLDQSLAVMADVLTQPAFRETDLERLRSNMLDGIRQEKASPRSIAGRILPELLYGPGHAYNTPWSGSGNLSTVTSLSRDDLVEYWKTWMRPDNGTLIVTGDTSMEELLPKLEQALSHWQAPSTPLPGKTISSMPEPGKATVYLIDYPGTSQSTIIASQLVMPIDDDNSLAFSLMNDVIGGQFTSRLNMNLREDKHWAYGSYSYTRNARGQRPYMATASVQIDKTDEAMAEMLKEFQAYVGKKPATNEELTLVKTNRINKLPGTYETNGALLGSVSTLVEYDLPDSHMYDYANRVESTGKEVIRKTAKTALHPDRFTWLVIGDLSKIKADIDKLNIGQVVVLDRDGNPVAQ